MKKSVQKIFALLLLLAMVLSTASCQDSLGSQTQTQTGTLEQTQSDGYFQKKTEEKELGTVKTPMTWETINSLPIASNSMSLAERRALCSDFFRLAQTFQWIPNEDVTYTVTASNKKMLFGAGTVFGGVPYVTEARGGSIYIAMQYYDEKTGVMDVKSVGGKNFAFVIGNHCSYGALWGWGRVVNSNNGCGLTNTMTSEHGCIPVGPYTYNCTGDWSQNNLTKTVCSNNGIDVMFESYAKLQTADGIVMYGTGGGHVCMIASNAVVVRENGKINGDQSYVLVHEQVSSPSPYTAADGSTITIEGRVDHKYSFNEIFKKNYLPFTFAELIGTDPVEEASATCSITDAAASIDTFSKGVVEANYAISDVQLTLTDAEGKVILSKFTANTASNKRSLNLSTVFLPSLRTYVKNADCTVTLDCRLSTGNVIRIYSGTLLKV